jgi:hypothetical protein
VSMFHTPGSRGALAPAFPGTSPRVLRYQPRGPQTLWIQGAIVLGLPGHPRAPPLPVSWRRVQGGTELTCL